MIRSCLLLLSILLIAPGCRHWQSDNKDFTRTDKQDVKPVSFARGFTFRSSGRNLLLTIRNPWQNASKVEYSYLLSDTLRNSEIINENHSLIRIPVRRVVCLSTTHIGFISYINQNQSVVGISGKNFVTNEFLRNKIGHDQLPDVGYDENLNFELILKLKPDVVFAYGVSGTVTNTIRKLNEFGIPTILIAEYLEEEPLAKMEWIKVFGALYGQEAIATQKFDSVVNTYQHLRALAQTVPDRPAVLLGLPWRGTWYISGGKSYVARLVSDAGGDYIFNKLDFKDSRPMALEKVYEQALNAKFWLNSGDALSKFDLLSVDNRFDKLPCVKQDRIFNNNNLVNPAGGNAFFESGVVEPEIILSDLIYILHPQLLPSHQLKYYRKLQ
jgi:iron complex transport system substrate-binding protein